MCRFCHQHGEGKRWYLKAEHYSEELLADMERRRYLSDFIEKNGNDDLYDTERQFHRAMSAPAWLRQLIYKFYERRYRRDHFGQVVPIEDLKRVMELANSIVRIPCICRKKTTGRIDANYCFGLGLDSEKLLGVKEVFLETFRAGPGVDLFERLTVTEALELHRGFENEGVIHTIWTFKTPFIGAICNCDRADCLAMVSHRYGFRLFFKGEYLGRVHSTRCVGCKACLSTCQFGAIGFSVVHRKAFIDPIRCHGCGICRNVCEQNAIGLTLRKDHPIANSLW
jgi:Pyruvate/2-oxoacid:ferredoxin oxidoreductase delta subunit